MVKDGKMASKIAPRVSKNDNCSAILLKLENPIIVQSWSIIVVRYHISRNFVLLFLTIHFDNVYDEYFLEDCNIETTCDLILEIVLWRKY